MRPSLDIPRSKPYHITPGYHGDLWLDPATGTILRITIEADLKGRDPVKRADTLIEYGPVSISGHSFICPVRSLTLHLDPVNPNDTTGAAPILQLNEIQFTNYHRFASTMRILTGAQQQPDFPSTGSTGPPDSASQSAMPKPLNLNCLCRRLRKMSQLPSLPKNHIPKRSRQWRMRQPKQTPSFM